MEAAFADQDFEVRIDSLDLPWGSLRVVRDDLLEGGTKLRAAVPFLRDQIQAGARAFVYASPFCGFAQIALAIAARHMNASCTLFCERDPASGEAHAFSLLAQAHGARIFVVPNLADAEIDAANFAAAGKAIKIPLGFDCQDFKRHLRSEVTTIWKIIEHGRGPSPAKLWTPVGSGTLAGVLRDVLPDSVQLNCVNVNVLDGHDARLQTLARRRGVVMHAAPQAFAVAAEDLPPIPSNLFYDAKLWSFIRLYGAVGDCWWNVAR